MARHWIGRQPDPAVAAPPLAPAPRTQSIPEGQIRLGFFVGGTVFGMLLLTFLITVRLLS